MNSEQELKIRRAIAALTIGQTVTLAFPGEHHTDIARVANAYARARGKPIVVRVTDAGLHIERVEAWVRDTQYAQIDALEVGQSVLIDVQPADHVRIRNAAAARNRSGTVNLTCSAETGGIRVERLALGAKRATNYPELDALQVGQSHVFPYPPEFHQRVRMAATSRTKQGKVLLTCTRVGDHIQVTRLPMTPEEIAKAGPVNTPKRTTKYDLERLSTVRELVFDFPDFVDQRRLRLAVTNKARIEGWTVRCRVSDDKKQMRVYRTDAGAPAADAA